MIHLPRTRSGEELPDRGARPDERMDSSGPFPQEDENTSAVVFWVALAVACVAAFLATASLVTR